MRNLFRKYALGPSLHNRENKDNISFSEFLYSELNSKFNTILSKPNELSSAHNSFPMDLEVVETLAWKFLLQNYYSRKVTVLTFDMNISALSHKIMRFKILVNHIKD